MIAMSVAESPSSVIGGGGGKAEPLWPQSHYLNELDRGTFGYAIGSRPCGYYATSNYFINLHKISIPQGGTFFATGPQFEQIWYRSTR